MADESFDIDARLNRLAQTTESVGPSVGFESRVMLAVAERKAGRRSTEPGWLDGVLRASPLALAVAALVAVGAVVVAVQSQQAYEAEAAVAHGTVEVGW